MTAPAMSKHLRVLRTRGLIEEQRLEEDARVRIFRLRRAPFTALQKWLGAFKVHAERRRGHRRGRGRR